LDEMQEQHERERDSDFPAENTDEDDPPFGNRVETKRKLRAVGCDGSEQEFDLFFEHESAGGREFWKRGDPGTAPVGASSRHRNGIMPAHCSCGAIT
jgi:hypothetical protein